MKCSNCGTKNKEGMKFCKNCGSVLIETINTYENLSPKKKSVKGIVILIFLIIIVLAAIGGCVYILLNNISFSGRESDSSVTEISNSNSIVENIIEENSSEAEATSSVSKVVIPDLVGLSQDDAIEKLENLGLNYKKTENDNDTVPKGYVISQSPVASKEAQIGDTITIYVSSSNALSSYSSNNSSKKAYMYCIASDFATMREKPSRTSRKIRTIKSRKRVEYLSADGEFYYVSYKGDKGYVLSEFLSSNKNAALNYGSGNAPLQKNDSLYCIASDYATLRKNPSRSAKEITKITTREEVTYLGKSGSFYHVKYAGKKGYVLKSYFSPDYDAPLNYGTN